jgi:hypothetical protein
VTPLVILGNLPGFVFFFFFFSYNTLAQPTCPKGKKMSSNVDNSVHSIDNILDGSNYNVGSKYGSFLEREKLMALCFSRYCYTHKTRR